jgi:23S rRNA (uracil1939-C5)-methyltransferase
MEIKVDLINSYGIGVAKNNNKLYKIPYALPDELLDIEIVKENSKYIDAKINKIITKSIVRKDNIECPYYYKCGGCSLLHLSTDYYNEFKKSILVNGLAKINFYDQLDYFVIRKDSRRRVTFHARKENKESNELNFGFYAPASDDIIDIDRCLLLEPEITEIIPVIQKHLLLFENSMLSNAADLKIIITKCYNGLDVLFKSKFPINRKTNNILSDLPLNIIRATWQQTGITDKNHVIFLRKKPVIMFEDFEVKYPINAFLQVSDDSQNAIIKFIKNHSRDGVNILDLFSGIGTYTFPLSSKAKHITSVEGKVMLDNMGIDNINFIEQDLYKNPIKSKKIANYDEVIINPPRNGASPQIKEIAKSGVKTVFFVSCDINTFLRDATVLMQNGYKLEKILGIDQFLYSHHIEIVALFKL